MGFFKREAIITKLFSDITPHIGDGKVWKAIATRNGRESVQPPE
ncbi:MAG TPA: hypothetical protein VGH32_08370 [Pirellulales bacterium]